MPYDNAMADRIRDLLADTPGLVEQKMFGGIGWTIGGHMAVGCHSDGKLMVRCSKDDFPAFMDADGADAMRRGGKPMSGWILVEPETVLSEDGMALWVGRGRDHATSMPPKPPKAKKAKGKN